MDQLIASGYSVWFAEYMILLTDRDNFPKFIERGIAESKQGLLFTCDNYAHSDHCLGEARLLNRKCGSKNLFEIQINHSPTVHQKLPFLKDCESIRSTDVRAILDSIREFSGHSIKKMKRIPTTPDLKFIGMSRNRSFSLHAPGWKITDEGKSNLNAALGDEGNGLAMEYTAHSCKFLNMNLYFGIEESYQRSRMSDDDRELYNELIEYSKKHIARVGSEVVGVHLLFKEGVSHYVVSYFTYKSAIWIRKYSITLMHPSLNKPVEFVFTFGLGGTFREYCAHTHVMDSVVRSLSWR